MACLSGRFKYQYIFSIETRQQPSLIIQASARTAKSRKLLVHMSYKQKKACQQQQWLFVASFLQKQGSCAIQFVEHKLQCIAMAPIYIYIYTYVYMLIYIYVYISVYYTNNRPPEARVYRCLLSSHSRTSMCHLRWLE